MPVHQSNKIAALPSRAGAGLKAEHYADILESKPNIGCFEVHPKNYMGLGGPPHHYLTRIRETYPISLHGVGLSIGGSDDLNREHLDRLKALVDRYQPESFSEHLAWSTHESAFYNDLLPLPYTSETLALVCDHVDELQEHIGRRMLLENPATYVVFQESSYDEIDFLKEIASRTGCSLLLDVTNVFISCTNHRRNADDYVDRFPLEHVGEIHLADHAQDEDDQGQKVLIDAHDRQVIEPVWQLLERTLHRTGPVPTLVEWDNDVPEWSMLFAEAERAEAYLKNAKLASKEATHAVV